jgi:hypothetical protein
MEETKWLKPSGKRVTKYGDSASVQAVTRVKCASTNWQEVVDESSMQRRSSKSR